MQELDATWGRVLRIWWLFLWRSLIGAVLLGAIIGAVFGFIIGVLGLSHQIIAVGSPIIGAIVGSIWAVLVMRMALRKHYSDFRIVLVPRS
jgi:hypothetical protein